METKVKLTDGKIDLRGNLVSRGKAKLKDSKQLYAAKYLTYLPTEEELSREIREQKEFFELQEGKKDETINETRSYFSIHR